ncbi:MAG TPA: tol-pal system protein YbgF [Nitrospirota bacterium]|nr:tol-pal system protein YbgF [Nitrospirota bacterium]
MTTKPFIATLGILMLLVACAPQAELVRTQSEMNDLRQDVKTNKTLVQDLQKQIDHDIMKRLDVLDANVKGSTDVQKVMADYGAKTDELTTDLQLLQGKLEENNFRIAEFAQKLDDRSVKIAELSARIDELETKVKMQSTGTSTVSTGQTPTAMGGEKASSEKMTEPSEAYRQAKSDYDKGNFDLALAGFQNYIVQFPNTSMIDNAQYWIGECLYSKKEYSKAIDAFLKVIKNYPKSEKVAGAKLKIGLSYINEKNYIKAKEYLHKVIKEHPSSTEAEIAKDRLAKIER